MPTRTLPFRRSIQRLPPVMLVGPVPVQHNYEAQYVRAADGTRWVRKLVDVTGPEQLLAEAISYQLAWLLRLPVPEAGVTGAGEEFGWCSHMVEDAGHYSPQRLAQVDGLSDFGRVVPLDLWVINEDRHAGNVLLVGNGTRKRVIFIDFGNAMVGHPRDYAARVAYEMREVNFAPRTVAPDHLQEGATEMLSRIAALTDPDLRGVVRDACELAACPNDAEDLLAAMLERRKLLPELVRTYFRRLGVTS